MLLKTPHHRLTTVPYRPVSNITTQAGVPASRHRIAITSIPIRLAASTAWVTIIFSVKILMCSIPMPASAKRITMSSVDLKLTGGVRWTRRPEAFHRYSQRAYCQRLRLCQHRHGGSAMEPAHRPLGRQLVTQARFHRSDADLWFLCPWLQSGWRQSAGRGAIRLYGAVSNGVPIHPLTFKPEFVDAYELGTKNTLADGGLTLNGDVFFYNYTGYQISRIVDRTAIN